MINNMGSLLNEWKEAGVKDSEKALLVTSCGYQKFISKNYSITRPKGRLDYQLIYIIKGKGHFTFGEEVREVSEGSIIVYPPLSPQLYSYSAEEKTELYWIHITGAGIKEYLNNLNLLGAYVHQVGIDKQFIELFEKIVYELQMKKPFCEHMASANFLALISSFARKKTYLKTNPNLRLSEDIKKTIEIMHKGYKENYTVEDYAGFCNLSLYRFIHKFKKYTGMTPLDYLTNIKINTAKDLIINSEFNMSEIAELVGYENPLYFSRVFKKITGICPSKYK